MYGLLLETIQFLGDVELKIFIDGELVDTLQVTGEIREGRSLESPAITQALKGREIRDVSFVGTMVMVYTEASDTEMESKNG